MTVTAEAVKGVADGTASMGQLKAVTDTTERNKREGGLARPDLRGWG